MCRAEGALLARQVILASALLVLSSCASHQAQEVRNWAAGRSIAELEQCAGKPSSTDTLPDGSTIAQWDYTEPTANSTVPIPVSLIADVTTMVISSRAGAAIRSRHHLDPGDRFRILPRHCHGASRQGGTASLLRPERRTERAGCGVRADHARMPAALIFRRRRAVLPVHRRRSARRCALTSPRRPRQPGRPQRQRIEAPPRRLGAPGGAGLGGFRLCQANMRFRTGICVAFRPGTQSPRVPGTENDDLWRSVAGRALKSKTAA